MGSFLATRNVLCKISSRLQPCFIYEDFFCLKKNLLEQITVAELIFFFFPFLKKFLNYATQTLDNEPIPPIEPFVLQK